MKFLILLSILCIFSQDLVEVTGKELKGCPKCKIRVQCFVDPCRFNPCGGSAISRLLERRNTVCKPCCFGCDFTCEQQLKG
ncbi:hypothetical protein ABFA07_014140 [Porites harrisoni]